MKKLMIVGAMAAASVAFGAEASYWAQVYDAAITMKTGVCKAGKATAATVKYYEGIWGKDNAPVDKGDEMGFRKQATRKISGLFWGCECETIAFPAWRRYSPQDGFGKFLGGYAFWDQAADEYFVLPNTVFGWGILNRMGADFKSVEGAWVLANNVNPQALYLMGAGFGKASVAAQRCRSIISKISGSFAGFRFPGMDDLVGSCPYCGIDGCTVEPFCDLCWFWTANTRLTAAYGAWSIKFNKTAANKLKSKARITQSYTFKKAGDLPAVLAAMEEFVKDLDKLGFDYEYDGSSYLMSKDEVRAAYLYAFNKDAIVVEDDGSLSLSENYKKAKKLEDDSFEAAYLKELGYDKITDEDFEEEELEEPEDDDDEGWDKNGTKKKVKEDYDSWVNHASTSAFPSIVSIIEAVVYSDES